MIFWEPKTGFGGEVNGFEPNFFGSVVIIASAVTAILTLLIVGVILGKQFGPGAVIALVWLVLSAAIFKMRREYKIARVKLELGKAR